MRHRVLEGLQEILLEFEVRELFFLQKAHGQLPQRIERKEPDVRVVVAADLQCYKFLR